LQHSEQRDPFLTFQSEPRRDTAFLPAYSWAGECKRQWQHWTTELLIQKKNLHHNTVRFLCSCHHGVFYFYWSSVAVYPLAYSLAGECKKP
jgi:hypothetical protein